MEKALKVKLFNRNNGGFILTEHGKELLPVAVRMESDAYEIERKLQAKNSVMQGLIRITIPNHFTSSPLMSYFKIFADKHPKVELEIIPSWSTFDLNRGEADIALRIFYKDAKPPEELIGTKIVDVYCANYASQSYLENHNLNDGSASSWIGWDDPSAYPDWVKTSYFPHLPIKHLIKDPVAQVVAAKEGYGLAMLPCFLCDSEEALMRIPAQHRWHQFDLWMLSHPDLRDAARFKELRQFIIKRFAQDKDLWAGNI